MASFQAGKLDDAEQHFKIVLRRDPKNVAALNLLGIVLMSRKKYSEAEHYLKSALKINSNSDVTFYNYGIVLKALERPAEALERFNQALAINSTVADAWNNRGAVLNELGRYEDAIEDFNKAVALNPNYAGAFSNSGKSYSELMRYDEALTAYDKALTIKLDLAEAWTGRGNVLVKLNRQNEAHVAYDKALTLNPVFIEAWLGRGNLALKLKRYDEARAAYDKALTQNPHLAEAWLGLGNMFLELERYDEAFSAYDKALSIRPDFDEVEGLCLHTKMHLCDWKNFDSARAHLSSSVREGALAISPFVLLAISSSPEEQLECGKLFTVKRYPESGEPIWRGERYDHDRIRVAYVSADFREHAMPYLMSRVFECHEKSRFDVTAISIGADDNSDMRRRLKASFERFIDAETMSDEQIADHVRSLEVDILVDLMGYTGHNRASIFAKRAAPIQINYLGYPGTMGASYFDYIIGDKTIFAASDERFYSEKLVRLPHCYLPNDRGRQIADAVFARKDFELPDDAFVFCCFNNSFKILPAVFDCWMRILKRTGNSVLWLLSEDAKTISNLRKEAVNRGIVPDRLVFAKRMPLSEHLARHRLADLFLDTLPYNAHTTASDALWAGLPVLTQIGQSFAARVAASLLNAVGLSELITHSQEEYEALAVELALDRDKLLGIKEKLEKNRLTTPLFDSTLFTRHLEAAYEAMYQRYQADLQPDHIYVSQ